MVVQGMEEKERHPVNQPDKASTGRWRLWLCRLVIGLWALQLVWLTWYFRQEIGDVAGRVWSSSGGEAVRQEDPFSRWLLNLPSVIPPEATYLFLDNYEAGKENKARYHLFPRRHLLLSPQTPPSLFFHTLRQYGVSYVLVRDEKRPLGPGLAAALKLGAAERLTLTGPGLVFRVDPGRLARGFYD